MWRHCICGAGICEYVNAVHYFVYIIIPWGVIVVKEDIYNKTGDELYH